jgi:hypothetical protein
MRSSRVGGAESGGQHQARHPPCEPGHHVERAASGLVDDGTRLVPGGGAEPDRVQGAQQALGQFPAAGVAGAVAEAGDVLP